MAKGYTAGLHMVNGCFDLLHAGHVDFLERAATGADRLVVAVNSDRSVRDLKGPGRPFFALEQRLIMLRALRCVSEAVTFEDELELVYIIESYKPEILVKNADDYQPGQVTGEDVVREFGGRVVYIAQPAFERTTHIVERLRRGGKT